MTQPEGIQELKKRYYNATLTEIFPIQKALWIFRVKPDQGLMAFKPGQYTTLGLGIWEPTVIGSGAETLKAGQEKQLLRRAYSVSHPILDGKNGGLYGAQGTDFFEFYVALVLNTSGQPTPPRLTPRLFALKQGDRLAIGPKMTGHYTLEGIQDNEQLVFFATGTGEAPHNAMIWELLSRNHRGPIVSCVCTRTRADQAYRKMHEALAKKFSNYRVIYLATRESDEPKIYCQDLVQSGEFEKRSGVRLTPTNTHVYLCGNPSMIGRPELVDGKKIYPKPAGIIETLERQGFAERNIHFEAYW